MITVIAMSEGRLKTYRAVPVLVLLLLGSIMTMNIYRECPSISLCASAVDTGGVTVDENGTVNVEDDDGNVSVDDDGNVNVEDGDGNVSVDDEGNVKVDDGEYNVTVQGDNVTVTGSIDLDDRSSGGNVDSISVKVSARTDGNMVIGGVSMERLENLSALHYSYEVNGDPALGTDGDDDDGVEGPASLGIYFEVSNTGGEIADIRLEIDLAGKVPVDVDRARIKLYWLNEVTGQWIRIDDSGYDEATGKLIADIDHLTIFAPMVETKEVGGNDDRGGAGIQFVIIIAAVIIAVFLVIFVLLRKKRKGGGEEEDEEDEEDKEDGDEEYTGWGEGEEDQG